MAGRVDAVVISAGDPSGPVREEIRCLLAEGRVNPRNFVVLTNDPASTALVDAFPALRDAWPVHLPRRLSWWPLNRTSRALAITIKAAVLSHEPAFPGKAVRAMAATVTGAVPPWPTTKPRRAGGPRELRILRNPRARWDGTWDGFPRGLQPSASMRAHLLLALLSLAPAASAASAAAQAIAVPVRCTGTCPARLRGGLTIDSVAVWAILDRGRAVTYVSHVIRNETEGSIDGAFFFPLPRDAVMERTMVYDAGELETYNEWSDSAASRREADMILRAHPGSAIRAYSGMGLVHVRVPPIGPHGTRYLQIGYTQPLQARGGRVAYRYPLAAGAVPARELTLRMTVKTETGFTDFHSPSHPVEVTWGTEMGRCPPRARCGFMGVPSRRVKEVRFAQHRADARRRDFVLLYTPATHAEARDTASSVCGIDPDLPGCG